MLCWNSCSPAKMQNMCEIVNICADGIEIDIPFNFMSHYMTFCLPNWDCLIAYVSVSTVRLFLLSVLHINIFQIQISRFTCDWIKKIVKNILGYSYMYFIAIRSMWECWQNFHAGTLMELQPTNMFKLTNYHSSYHLMCLIHTRSKLPKWQIVVHV